MDAPVEATESVEATNVDALPDASEPTSFEASLEAAFASLNQVEVPQEPEESNEKSNLESFDLDSLDHEQEGEESVEDEPEVEESEVEESEVEDTDSDDPIESLTEDIGDEWTPKAANRFKELKTELKANRSELEQLRQQTKEYESKIQELTGLVENKDVEKLQEKLAEYEQNQILTNLEQTEVYKEAVANPLAELVSRADEIADKYDVDPDTLIDIISLDDPDAQEEQLAELLPEASDRDKARIFRIMEEIDPILDRREKLYENAEAALDESMRLEEQRKAAQAAENAQFRQNITRNVVERVQEKLPFLKGIEGLDMQAIQQKAAETDPTVLHAVDHAYNAVSAQVFPAIVRQYLQMRQEVESLTDRLAEYEDAEPAMSGQTKASSVTGSVFSDDMTFEQRVNAALGVV